MKQQQQQGGSDVDGRSVLDPHDGQSMASGGHVGPSRSLEPLVTSGRLELDVDMASKSSFSTAKVMKKKRRKRKGHKKPELDGSLLADMSGANSAADTAINQLGNSGANAAGSGAHSPPSLTELQGLAPTLCQVEETLRKLATGIENDREKNVLLACRDLRSEARRAIELVSAIRLGMATEKLCAAVAEVKQLQTTKDRHRDDTTCKEGRRTWRDVAKDGASSDHLKPRTLDWVTACNFFLKARDHTWAIRSMPNFEFSAQVDRLLRALPRLKDKPVLVERVVRTSVGDWKVQAADDCTQELETYRDVAILDMGRWVVEKMHPLTQASLVIRDIPVEATE